MLHSSSVEVREEFAAISSLLPPSGFRGLNRLSDLHYPLLSYGLSQWVSFSLSLLNFCALVLPA